MVWDESNIVTERHNNAEITRATLLQRAIVSVLSSKGGTAFQDTVNSLNVVTKPNTRMGGEQRE